jgi:hypothetical protein
LGINFFTYTKSVKESTRQSGVDERNTTKTHHKCEERTGRSKIQGVHDGVQSAVSWYQETGTHVRTSSECMRRKRDQDFYAERGAHEGASRGEIAYTTDNERELACRRRKEKGGRLLSDEEGEAKN